MELFTQVRVISETEKPELELEEVQLVGITETGKEFLLYVFDEQKPPSNYQRAEFKDREFPVDFYFLP